MPAQAPDAAAQPGEPHQGRYTGVVVIHGIGNEKRNATLQEALDALSYWFNHHAELDLRAEGTGRIWLTTDLRDSADLDAPASRATMELVAPTDVDAVPDAGGRVRLEFREAWWAESFGLPAIGPTLRWARVQLREQLTHLLLPIGIRLGPAAAASRAPAHEIAQALTYRPEQNTPGAPGMLDKPDDRDGGRLAAGVGLWVYDFVQYFWKLTQWLLFALLTGPLFLLLGVVRLLACIPFLQSSLITGASAVINYVVLHWVASMQVFLLEYTRSTVMRERFQREVEALLADPQCERIVVIAHSMGTVISYEGLTTLLERPEWQDAIARRPITYICLAQALRRIWLLARTDPERLHEVLPDGVRWLHFWARYDPVAVGPLDPEALPQVATGAPTQVRAAHAALRARLALCENIDVVNTDSMLSDHTTYWQNVEQVVGPIALELVAGHPALERLVRSRLATRAEVRKRRQDVAWRALVSLAGGFSAAAALVALDVANGGGLGRGITDLSGAILGSPQVQRFLDTTTSGLSTLIGSYLASCAHSSCGGLHDVVHNPDLIVPYLLASYLRPEYIVTAVAALALLGVGIQVTAALVAAPSPFAFRGASPRASATRSVIIFAGLSLALGTAGLLLAVALPQAVDVPFANPRSLTLAAGTYIWLIGLAEFAWFLALALALVDAAQGRRWAWVSTLVAGILLVLAGPSAFAIAAAVVVLVGCLTLGIDAARRGCWGVVVGLAVVALPLTAAIGDLLRPHTSLTFGALVVVAPLAAYGLWAAQGPLRRLVRADDAQRGALALATLSLLLSLLAGYLPTAPWAWMALIAASTFLGVGALVWSLADAARARRWGWLAATALLTAALIALTHGYTPTEELALLPIQLARPRGQWLVWPLPFVVAALSYGLWAGTAAHAVPARAVDRRGVRVLPSGLARVARVGALVVVTGSLLGWDIAPRLQATPARLLVTEFPLSVASSGSANTGTTGEGPFLPFIPGAPSPARSGSAPGFRPAVGSPLDIVAGPDGNLWFTVLGQFRIGSITLKGTISQFDLPKGAGQAVGITAGPDGNLWFTELEKGRIGRMTLAGVVREFPLPHPGSEPRDITTGPDGNLWFAEIGSYSGTAHIGRITPTGAISEFPLPDPDATPGGITAGPDGNVWYTESGIGGSFIVRSTPEGAVQAFPLEARSDSAAQIIAGPDGNLWFTERQGQRSAIGRITPEGSISEFPLPDPDATPGGITAGPDGALWFTEQSISTGGAARIGRITPEGAISEFPLPNAKSEPEGIAAGPDGNLWFAETYTQAIGRMTPAGVGRDFPMPVPGSAPCGIVAGPDGNLWYTDELANQIGRMTPAGAVRQFALPTVGANPCSIAKGQDGNLWFTESGAGKIGCITPAGDVREFALPSSPYNVSLPTDITAGPDGDVWFTDAFVLAIGHITPAGVVQEFALGYQPTGITAGPDGNLWFTSSEARAIVRITPAGVVRTFELPNDGDQPFEISVGPDGNLWFTVLRSDASGAPLGSAIGRITPAGEIREWPLPNANSSLFGIAAGPDGNVWFTIATYDEQAHTYGHGAIGRITSAGEIRVFPLPDAHSVPFGIAAGPDGNVWFTDPATDQIAEISPWLADLRVHADWYPVTPEAMGTNG